MKESIGGTWLFGLVITFIAIFAAIVTLSTNYSRCYKIKDEIITSIETYNGVNEDSLSEINKYINSIGYRSKGKCPDDGSCWYGFSTSSNNSSVQYGQDTFYCIKKYDVVTKTKRGSEIKTNAAIGHPSAVYYGVVVFFDLSLPVLGSMFKINISGETSQIFVPNQIENLSCQNG